MQELNPEAKFAKRRRWVPLVSLRKPESQNMCELIARYTNHPVVCLRFNKLLYQGAECCVQACRGERV
jgi:hypothetical protein